MLNKIWISYNLKEKLHLKKKYITIATNYFKLCVSFSAAATRLAAANCIAFVSAAIRAASYCIKCAAGTYLKKQPFIELLNVRIVIICLLF